MKLSKIVVNVSLAFSLVFGVVGISNAATYPKINRSDLALSIGDIQFNGVWFAYTNNWGSSTSNNSTSCESNGQCYVPTVRGLWGSRAFGIDSITRISMPTLGIKSDLANLFYLAVDASFAGNSNSYYGYSSNGGFITAGVGVNAGFMYPILTTGGSNKYLANKKAQPVSLNLFAELGVGYGLNVNISEISTIMYHTVNPGIALGLNMGFKAVPELELEVGYKMMPGWRSNLYTRLEYDFAKTLGFHVQLDALFGALNTGLTFRF